MKWTTHVYIKPFTALLPVIFLIACNDSPGNELDKTAIEPVPASLNLSPLNKAIRSTIIDIETKEIALAGDSVIRLNIEGTEVIRFSKKDYYREEMRSQDADFKRYLQYLDKVSQNKNISDPLKRQESQAKHNAVMAYLQKMIKTASDKPEIYKVVYYLQADTRKIHYNRQKTMYLDKEMKKITGDYRFLSASF